MMVQALQTDTRELLKSYAMQHFRNEVWEAVLQHAPCCLPDRTIEQIEQSVLVGAEELTSQLTTERLRSPYFLNIMISDAIGETRNLLRKAAVKQVRNQQA